MKPYEIFIILLFLVLHFPLIKATGDECNGCDTNTAILCSASSGSSCNSNCRPKFTSSSITCYLCNFSGQNFYKINDDGTCTPKATCDSNEKIVHGSNECVSSCDSNSYKMGDYCYLNMPSNSDCDTTSKICTCKYKYYITDDNKQEYHCLGQNDDCPNEYDYYNENTKECLSTDCTSKKKKIEYRSDGSVITRCSTACFENEKLTSDGNYCIDNCPSLSSQKFYYPNANDEKTVQCVSDCSTYNLRELDNKCVSSCESLYYLDGNTCANSCPSGFYKLVGTEKVCVTQADSANCLYSQSESGSSIKKCYSSCLEIGTDYIYQKDHICSNEECNYHSTENTVKICYNSKQDCKNANYEYFQEKKCLIECNGYEDGDAQSNSLKYCYADLDACKSDNHIYYTDPPNKKCYASSCPTGLYPKKIEENKYLCTSCSDLKISNGYCKDNCENDECYFIGDNNCYSILNKFYYASGSDKICVNDCKSETKYYFEGTKECIDDCKKTENGVQKYFYYNPTNNLCLQQCNIGDNLYAKEPSTSHEKCDTKCPSGYNYLVENTYKCLDGCPETHPYSFKDNNFDTNNHFICKTISSCSGETNLYYDGACSSPQNCKDNNKFKIDSKNICVENCEVGYNFIEKVIDEVYKCRQSCDKFTVDSSNECVEKCPSTAKYIGTGDKCKTNCDSDGGKFYLFSEEDSYNIYKCVTDCPIDYKLTTNSGTVNQCYSKCPQSNKYLLASENKCYDNCKSNNLNPFSLSYTENGVIKNICASSCNSANPNYEANDKVCKNGCELDGFKVIDYDGKCIAKCIQSSDYKYNLDGKCVNKCTGNKNRYYEDTNNNEFKCTEKCESPNNYILDGKCVDQNSCLNTQYFYNPVKKNSIQTGEYECVLSNCPNNYFKKDGSSNKICLDKCITTDYALIDTHECVPSCDIQASASDSTYIYHTYKPGTTYTINTCVKECPEDKPYLNGNECVNSCPNYIEDNKCVPSCSTHDYYIGQILPNDRETLNICRDDCPLKYPYYIVDPQNTNKFICSYECPSELKFHKNVNPSIIGMKCNNDCPDATYKFLSDDEKECLKQCPSGKYYINAEGQKCHNACPEEKSYHSRNNYECFSMENCPNKFVDYSNKLCIDSCSGFKYKYEKRDSNNNNALLYTVCLNDYSVFNKYLTPGNICVDSCEENANLEIDTTASFKCKCKLNIYIIKIYLIQLLTVLMPMIIVLVLLHIKFKK